MDTQTTMTESQYSALFQKTQAIIDTLPQRGVLNDKVVDWWIKETIKREGQRVVWHAHRAAGIGGSEAGEFLLSATGKPQAYQSLEEIWMSKMLLSIPQRPTIYMRRGNAMEDLARRVYLRLTGYQSILESDEIVNGFSKPHPAMPHIVGNPDEVVDTNNIRVISDFKVRSNLDSEAGVSLINGAQLHWYGMLHEGNLGRLPDGYGLAELDIPNEMIDDMMTRPPEDWDAVAKEIASINRPGFGMKTSHFKHNPKMADILARLTKEFWEKHVLTGTPYSTPKPTRPASLTVQDSEAVERAQNNFMVYKLAESVAKDKAQAARAELLDIGDRYELSEWPFETSGLSSGYTKKFNADAAASRLIQKGIDRESIQKPSNKPDPEAMIQTLEAHNLLTDSHFKPEWDTRKLKAALKEHEVPAKDFESSSFRIGLTTKKADLPIREALEEEMGAHIGEFMQSSEHNSPGQTQNEIGMDDLDFDDEDSPSMGLA